MRFKRTMCAKSSVKKLKEYEFDLTKEDVEKGLKATYDKPYFVRLKEDTFWCGLSKNKNTGKLRVVMYHSYDVFEPIGER